MKANPGFCSQSLDGLHHPSDDEDDDMVDIAGATLDFSSTDDVPPLSSGGCTGHRPQAAAGFYCTHSVLSSDLVLCKQAHM